ncbi:MAG: DNA topoisomerase IV subunit A [Phycisphaerae bacterium]|nr:DNA topoisomerase IV subunit A [Phycisphaerae bacterium]
MARKAGKSKTRSAPTPRRKAASASAAPRRKKVVRGRKKEADTGSKLIDVAGGIAEQVSGGRDPGIHIPVRALSNVSFDKKAGLIRMGGNTQRRSFFNVGHAKKFMQTTLIAAGCKELIDQEKTTSIRDLFYHCKHTIPGTKENTFDEQSESDPIIEDLEVAVSSLREELGLFAEPKGAMVGPMTIEDKGDTIDLARMGSGGWAIPSIVESDIIQFKRGKAKFVLLIEKGAVWRRFSEDRFWEKHKCMIIHGGGQPPRGVRRLVWRMHHELKLPVYVLVDNDPWGYYIYSVIKQGSINLAFESQRMAIPAARFIGMSAFDAERFGIDKTVSIKLAEQDIRRAKEVMNYTWFQSRPWQREIKQMLKLGVKLELEALSSKDFSFITESYLPRKLKDRQWLD